MVALVAVAAATGLQPLVAAPWLPAESPIMTPWAADVTPRNVHQEYPRPQMVRKDWANLNGLWDYSITTKDAMQPAGWDGKILVPFPVESALSGVKKRVGEGERLWYRREFTVPRKWRKGRVLLHFGAVDWETRVWVNGVYVGIHRGGYDAFNFDITSALTRSGKQKIVVSVWDPTDAGTQPRGKQVRRPGGIWYTSVTGIWQTAWLEPVPLTRIESIRITPDLDTSTVTVSTASRGVATQRRLEVRVLDGPREVASGAMQTDGAKVTARSTVTLPVPDAKPWSPDSPFLYDLELTLVTPAGKDEVKSYFGMRKVSLGKDANGFTRILLNNEPLFQLGPLDQGWWPDGLYTAASDEALRYDVAMTRQLGFNMARKHVKVEPARWYFWCDKLGLLVWQDMPSGDKYIGGNDPDIERSPESAKQFEKELKAMVGGHYNHPCIIMWVPYNEGWGQWDTPRIVKLIKQWDPTRLVNNASGWSDRKVGDVHDIHRYPGPGAPEPEEDRAIVLGEYGGLGLPVPGHTWQDEKNWGYRSFEDSESLTAAYLKLQRKLHPLVGSHGLSAAVYTQTSDVEIEVNGLMTYDRALVKMDTNAVIAANKALYGPPPPPLKFKHLVPTSQKSPREWRYTTSDPGEGWEKPDFDDDAWPTGKGGFGTEGTPGAVVGTVWDGNEIWLRRTFDFAGAADKVLLLMHHDEDVEVYINGELAAKERGYVTDYEDFTLRAAARETLKPAGNVLAVHCRQTGGGQFIDVGLVEVEAD